MPVLALWAKFGVIETCFNALELWRQRAHQIEGEALNALHGGRDTYRSRSTYDRLFSRNPVLKKKTTQ